MIHLEPSPALWVTLIVHGYNAAWYQPAEGGWRCEEDGPYRDGQDGRTLTFDTLDSAAAHMAAVELPH